MKWFLAVIALSTALLNCGIAEAHMAKRSKNYIEKILAEVASEIGVSFKHLRAVIGIESNFNPKAKTGSYKGLGQLSNKEFRKWGGGNIYDPVDNARATAKKYKAEASYFRSQFGRDPEPADIYLIHQQGRGGYAQHLAAPDRAAWKSMHATREGRTKGEKWSKRAIWGNLPKSEKRRFGSVENVTSRDFTRFWTNNVNRRIGVEPTDLIQSNIPERGMRMPQSRKAALGVGEAGGMTSMSELPTSRRKAGAKFQYRAGEGDFPLPKELPPMPEQKAQTSQEPQQQGSFSMPAAEPVQQPSGGSQSAEIGAGQPGLNGAPGFTPELLDRTFGAPFGELFANSKGVPPPIPLFNDFASGQPKDRIGFNQMQQPIGRQMFAQVFGF